MWRSGVPPPRPGQSTLFASVGPLLCGPCDLVPARSALWFTPPQECSDYHGGGLNKCTPCSQDSERHGHLTRDHGGTGSSPVSLQCFLGSLHRCFQRGPSSWLVLAREAFLSRGDRGSSGHMDRRALGGCWMSWLVLAGPVPGSPPSSALLPLAACGRGSPPYRYAACAEGAPAPGPWSPRGLALLGLPVAACLASFEVLPPCRVRCCGRVGVSSAHQPRGGSQVTRVAVVSLLCSPGLHHTGPGPGAGLPGAGGCAWVPWTSLARGCRPLTVESPCLSTRPEACRLRCCCWLSAPRVGLP